VNNSFSPAGAVTPPIVRRTCATEFSACEDRERRLMCSYRKADDFPRPRHSPRHWSDEDVFDVDQFGDLGERAKGGLTPGPCDMAEGTVYSESTYSVPFRIDVSPLAANQSARRQPAGLAATADCEGTSESTLQPIEICQAHFRFRSGASRSRP
jgi:hypothetical protein